MGREKFIWLMSGIIIAFIFFVGCNKNNDNETAIGSVSVINARVNGGDDYNNIIAVVKLLVDDVEVATSSYSNGGFTINLPDNMDDYLKPFDIVLSPEIKISKSNVMYAPISSLSAYNEDDEKIGYFYYVCYKDEIFVAEAGLCFYNDDFSITGSYEEIYEYPTGYTISTTFIWDCYFKKGWNFFYWHGNSPDGNGNRVDKITTAIPGKMYWLFRANDDRP